MNFAIPASVKRQKANRKQHADRNSETEQHRNQKHQQGPRPEKNAMPLYEYQCTACGKLTEKRQKFSDPEITECPHCGGRLERTITAPAVQFKGGGWYADLYSSGKKPAANASADSNSGSGEAAKSDGGTKSDASTKSDSGGSNATSASPAPSAAPSATPASTPAK